MKSYNLQKKFSLRKFLFLLFCLFFSVCFIRAEKFPLKHFTIADGLPQNSINSITQDKKGFFWFGTKGGLSRFDGYDFVNFTEQEGLPKNEILDFLETREGDFWLATSGGLVKFAPEGKIYHRVMSNDDVSPSDDVPLFTTYRLSTQKVSRLFQDSRGTIWIGTSNGLLQLQKDNEKYSFLPIDIGLQENESKYIYAIYEDREGFVWIGTTRNLTRISPGNHLKIYQDKDTNVGFQSILEDHSGNFWVGTYAKGLFQFAVDENGLPKVVRQFANHPDSEVGSVDKIIESADGKLWIGGMDGLYEFAPAENKLLRYTRTSGIGYYLFHTMTEDRDGNLWLGTTTNGVYRLSTEGLVSFGTEDRISFVRSVGFDNENHLILTGFVTNTELDEKGAKVQRDISGKIVPAFEWRLGKLNENGFSWVVPKFPKSIADYSWGEGQISFQAKNGEWWIATGEGLFRFPKVKFEDLKNTLPANVFDEKNGLKIPNVFHLFEDSKENIWISTDGNGTAGFYKWERSTQTLHDLSAETNFSSIKYNLINSFAEDRAGNIWIGFRDRGFARLRNGKFDYYGDEQNIPRGDVGSIFFDRENRLWLALQQGGILRIDDPEAENLSFVNYTKNDGLSGNRAMSVTEDLQGFIYIGTDNDVNRFNPQTHEFKYLTLARDQLQREYRSAACDKNGTLWFGTTEGLIKYVPVSDKPIVPPKILITNVIVGFVPQKVSAIGTTALNLPTLAPEQNQVRINYVSLSNLENEGDEISYQYKINDDDWSKPSKERFVNFANLSPGNYQIYFRAVVSGGISNEKSLSENPAFVKFRILPPIYLRWWFIALGMLICAGIIYAFYRARLGKLLELERARTLIATDLHDDIGSNLSKISVLSEVVRMQLEREGQSDHKLLGSIAEISRESVGSMSDIVWAINPKRDSVLEMTRKMREHAEEIFVPKGVVVKFAEPNKSAKLKLPMNLRRDLYLIFKEAINNAAKHSKCGAVTIIFQVGSKEIFLEVEDDGGGFDFRRETNGNGLSNIRTRVERLRGRFEIESEKSHGTILKIYIPH